MMEESELIVFHAYEYFLNAKNYVNFDHLCNLCGVNTRKMSKLMFPNAGFGAEDLLAKSASLLGLSFKEECLLREKMLHKPLTGHSPATATASYIFTLFNHKLDIKTIANALNISVISIKRYSRKYCSM